MAHRLAGAFETVLLKRIAGTPVGPCSFRPSRYSTTLSSPAQFPKTLDDFNRRMAAQFPGLAKELDAVYPVKADADIAEAMLGLGRDQTFTLEIAPR